MGIYYGVFAEAKINNQWRGIDFYVFANDKYHPVEIIGGKSFVGSALEEKAILHYPVSAKELSPELQRDHSWYVEQEEQEHWIGSMMYTVMGSDIEAMRLDRPEYCGFVDKTYISAFEKDETEDIPECLNAKEFAELPPDVRIGYQWYEWSEVNGTQAVWKQIRRGLFERICAYNESRYEYDFKNIPPFISMADTRIVVLMS